VIIFVANGFVRSDSLYMLLTTWKASYDGTTSSITTGGRADKDNAELLNLQFDTVVFEYCRVRIDDDDPIIVLGNEKASMLQEHRLCIARNVVDIQQIRFCDLLVLLLCVFLTVIVECILRILCVRTEVYWVMMNYQVYVS